MVLLAVADDNVVGDHDPFDDLHTLELELVLADADSVETQITKRRKMARNDPSLRAWATDCTSWLDGGRRSATGRS